MKTTLCYSVRVKSLTDISPKAVLVETFDGRKDVLPSSQIFGIDADSSRSDAYWIAAWILPKKNIQWSAKKMRLVSTEDSGNTLFPPQFAGLVEYHEPRKINPVESNDIESLRRPG